VAQAIFKMYPSAEIFPHARRQAHSQRGGLLSYMINIGTQTHTNTTEDERKKERLTFKKTPKCEGHVVVPQKSFAKAGNVFSPLLYCWTTADFLLFRFSICVSTMQGEEENQEELNASTPEVYEKYRACGEITNRTVPIAFALSFFRTISFQSWTACF